MWGSLANLAEQAGSLAKQAADSQLVRLRPPSASELSRMTERVQPSPPPLSPPAPPPDCVCLLRPTLL